MPSSDILSLVHVLQICQDAFNKLAASPVLIPPPEGITNWAELAEICRQASIRIDTIPEDVPDRPITRHRARRIQRADGPYINVADCRLALKDPQFVEDCAAILKIGFDRKRSPIEAFRNAIGNAFFELSGDADLYRSNVGKSNTGTVKSGGQPERKP